MKLRIYFSIIFLYILSTISTESIFPKIIKNDLTLEDSLEIAFSIISKRLFSSDEGRKYVKDLKDNETFGQYISLVDSLILPYLNEYTSNINTQIIEDSLNQKNTFQTDTKSEKKIKE